MLSPDTFVNHHVCERIEAVPQDSRYRLAQLTGDRRRALDAGCAVGSMLNIALFKISLQLLQGRFDYEEGGIMDRTHLRFFTLQTEPAMLRMGGLNIVHLEGVYAYPFPAGLSELVRLGHAGRTRLKAILTRLWPAMFAYQFIMVGRKIGMAEESR